MGILGPISLFISSFDMKRFLIDIMLYAVIILLITVPVSILKAYLEDYKANVIGSEIYCAINKSQQKSNVKKLLLGDSVGNQLYPCKKEYDSIVSLACNQAITLAGHYFLMKNYIETNFENLPERIILLVTPFSLENDVDKFAYHYFLKPFPPYKWSDLYTEHLKQRIHSIPFYWTANLPLIRTSPYTPKLAVPSFQSIKSISPLSYEYLLKMDSLTKANNIDFCMVSTPVRDDRKNDIVSFWENLPTEYMSHLSELLEPYKESVMYLPSEWYSDHVHFVGEKTPDDYLNLLSE